MLGNSAGDFSSTLCAIILVKTHTWRCWVSPSGHDTVQAAQPHSGLPSACHLLTQVLFRADDSIMVCFITATRSSAHGISAVKTVLRDYGSSFPDRQPQALLAALPGGLGASVKLQLQLQLQLQPGPSTTHNPRHCTQRSSAATLEEKFWLFFFFFPSTPIS